MTKETMNIHKALCELKMLDKRINEAIRECEVCDTAKQAIRKVGSKTVEEYSNDVRAQFQKVTDLIARRDSIKRAVVLSNAITKVNIAGKTYTVAEAIEMKNHGIGFSRMLASRLSGCANEMVFHLRESEIALEKQADIYIQSLLGGKEKVMTAEAIKIRDEYIAAQRLMPVDPLNAAKVADDLKQSISNFEVEVDSALSVSNATTSIEIEY